MQIEPRDATWASEAEGRIRSAVDNVIKEGEAQFSVKTLRCLTSVCELVLTASTPDQLHRNPVEIMSRVDSMGTFDVGVPEKAPDGSGILTYRMFRSGYPRPDDGT